MNKQKKTAIIIGAGPAGLTAAYELITRTEYQPIIFEASDHVGGISATIDYKGNKIDIGGHRFFSKSQRVMRWWLDRLPLEATDAAVHIAYHGQRRTIPAGTTAVDADRVMLVRKRKSRILFLRTLFDYPLKASVRTVQGLGYRRSISLLLSYVYSRLFPRTPEKTLEDFFINRFGYKLYSTFFKSYTEKVWGQACSEMSAEWGRQRIKGLSISAAIKHMVRSKKATRLEQKDIETSLIEYFLYPKYGPGQMWQSVADEVVARGGQIVYHAQVCGIEHDQRRITSITVNIDGEKANSTGDLFFSTMPIRALVGGCDPELPQDIQRIAAGLKYRDFITVGVLLNRLVLTEVDGSRITDNWIYIQESDVIVGRLQIFNNWSPFLVKDPEHTLWIGLEYFCSEGDVVWEKSDEELQHLAKIELEKLDIARVEDILDSVVVRMPKAYPSYTGTYADIERVRTYLNGFENLYCIGRNGMHRYNNQDHSMLAAMTAVDMVVSGERNMSVLWNINTEQEYHEERKID